MLQRALLSGKAELWPETFVSRIRRAGGGASGHAGSGASGRAGDRVSGVDYIGPDGVEKSLDADYVFLAAGAIETPRLLLLSGFEHDLIGRHLMVHFQTIATGHFRGPSRCIPRGVEL